MTDLKELRKFYNHVIGEKRDHVIECSQKDSFAECMQRICKCKVAAGVIPRGKAFTKICKIEDSKKAK